MDRIITVESVAGFAEQLREEEKSPATTEKYLRDIRAFFACMGAKQIGKEDVIAYKRSLIAKGYAVRSVNSVIASLNCFFSRMGFPEYSLRALRLQKELFRPEEKELTREEYARLCRAAREKKNARLELLLQTVCGTGIRISELPYITVEAARCGEAKVNCKSKTRTVFLVRDLRKKLLRYAAEQKIGSGSIFITRNGTPLNRTNIWRDMKSLCGAAKVNPGKVFPHNLRHLFARVFYANERDLARLADVLGHSNINTTRIYIVSTGVEHRRTMERMNLIL